LIFCFISFYYLIYAGFSVFASTFTDYLAAVFSLILATVLASDLTTFSAG
jgi:hypothetical protein